MVHQASTLPEPPASRRPHPERPSATGRRHLSRRRPAADPWTRIVGQPPSRLLVLFLIALMLPINFSLAGLQLTAYSCMLIVCIIPAFLYFIRLPDARIVGLDVFMALHVLWLGVAIYYNHGSNRLIFILNQSLMLFGAYFFGRVLVRNAEDHFRLFQCMLRILLVFFPLAFIEFAFHRSLIDMAMGHSGAGSGAAGGFRLGFRRVEGVFPHPILFGVFSSIFVANFFYVFWRSLTGRLWKMGLAMTMTFMALSTGPLLAMLVQLLLISWERLLRFFPPKWFVLVLFGAGVLGILQLAYPGGIVAFIIETFAYNPQTGYGRTEILEYGGASVLRHPFFGIGLSPDWGAPWWRPSSVDNYWLGVAMRYGLPALAFMWLGLALHTARIMARRGLGEDAANYRKGYLMALAGLFVVLGTVHIWGAVSVFIMFYLGAGAWIYAGDATEPAARRERRPGGAGRAPEPAADAPAQSRRARRNRRTEIGLSA